MWNWIQNPTFDKGFMNMNCWNLFNTQEKIPKLV